MVRRILLLLAAMSLLAVPAFAKRSKVPALEAGTIRAEPKADATKVVDVKKGENLLVLGKQGEWSQVQTDGGKKGWILSKAVSTGGLAALDSTATDVTAAEGDSALAMRGRPFVPRTIVVGMGGLKSDLPKRLGELLTTGRKLKILEVRDEAAAKTGSAAGGLDGATQLAGAKGADLVVAIQAATGDAITYEIVDLKHKAVLGAGTTTTTKPIDEVAAAVAKATEDLVKNPADTAAAPAATSSDAAAAASPAATAAPAATPSRATKKGAPHSIMKKRAD